MALVERIKLDPGSEEYEEVAKRFNSRYVVEGMKCELLCIERVRNDSLEQRFAEKRQQYLEKYGHVGIVKGWHGTKKENVASILKNNFDVATSRIYRFRFGAGVSFSSLPSYASYYCDKTSEASMLLADVLVSNVVEVPENKGRVLRARPGLPGTSLPYDTTAKNKDRMDVFVKADRDAFLPTHVVHFKRGATPPLPRARPGRTQAVDAELDLLMESLCLKHDYDVDLVDDLWSYDKADHSNQDNAGVHMGHFDSYNVDCDDLYDDSSFHDNPSGFDLRGEL